LGRIQPTMSKKNIKDIINPPLSIQEIHSIKNDFNDTGTFIGPVDKIPTTLIEKKVAKTFWHPNHHIKLINRGMSIKTGMVLSKLTSNDFKIYE
jgi:hypothetical protein